MKAHLMFRDRDLDAQRPLPSNLEDLTQDLELGTLLNAMAAGDRFLYDRAHEALASGLSDLDTIRYRQDILRDCLRHPAVVRDIYRITEESVENKKKQWLGIFTRYPTGILNSAVKLLVMFVSLLKRLRSIADAHAEEFESAGFTAFFAMIERELDDAYFERIDFHLRELRFRRGVLLSIRLGKGNEGTGHMLHRPQARNWIKRVFSNGSRTYGFSISPRDMHSGRALSELKDRGINLIANAVAQAADHIDSFFIMLRRELAFYVGCLNLYERLQQLGAPVSFPTPASVDERVHRFRGLYDVSLALTMHQQVVGSDVDAAAKNLVFITGANQGGKSTFLRSIGLAQLMMQCGMYVPAESGFHANVSGGLFTHYRREEDATMTSGKLDEELTRMSRIVDDLVPNSMVLFNESFAATNEHEGSEIAQQVVSALLEKGIKVFFVTHLYEFPRGFYMREPENVHFLRAERLPDGTRTFKLREAAPLQTSYGQDLYQAIFEQPQARDQEGEATPVVIEHQA